LLTLLLTAYPESVSMRDCHGNLPFHLVVSHNRGQLWIHINEMTELLYRAYPRAILETDSAGNLPH